MGVYLGGTKAAKNILPFSDVAFFDPNLGEIWFENADNFALFFSDLVTTEYKGYGGWMIHNFAPRR